MPTPSPTIRLFVSSTFSDLKSERDALQREVFPRLKQLCLSKGLRFQAIDLRWGISEEASRDNRTMRICLRELRRCQQDRPKPNFLILLGDRYGWRPLPEIIPATLFELLKAEFNTEVPELLKRYYRRDDNAVPPVYELQPRGDNENWPNQIEKPLLAALEQAAQALGLDLEKEGVFIGASATEQEIIEGALKVPDAATHVRAFFRTIKSLPDPAPEDYVETGEAEKRLKKLKDRIGEHIGVDNVCAYRVPWCARIAPPEKEPESDAVSVERILPPPKPIGIHPDDLKEFCEQAWKHLSEVVEQQIVALARVPPDELEEQEHQDFGKERCRHFVGRVEPLERIAAYLREGSGKPFAVIGPSGSGKSAVMAKAVEKSQRTEDRSQRLEDGNRKTEDKDKKSEIIARYIGATPGSSDLIQLLRNLVAEIRRHYPTPVATEGRATISERPDATGAGGKAKPGDAEIPFEINPLINAFHEALQRPTASQSLWIFLDALDQLTASNNAHSLAWLPAKLSEHVRLVVSAALPSESGTGILPVSSETTDPRTTVMAALTSRLDTELRVTLAPLTIADGEQMLTNLLADARRTLQPTQRQAILETFKIEGSPLWLRSATEEAAWLASWQPMPSFAPTTQGLLGQVLDRLSREDEHGEKLVSRTLSYLACARHGLAEDELIEILSADKEVMADFRRRSPDSPKTESLPVAVWVRLHGDLSFYLAEHQAQGANLIGFYHRGFLETVEKVYLKDSAQCIASHAKLAEYFRSKAQEPSSGTWSLSSSRPLAELPYHLTGSRLWSKLEATLADPMFCEARCRTSDPFNLLGDFRYALEAHRIPAIAIIQRAAIAGLEAMLERPDLCLQTLINRLDWLVKDEPMLLRTAQDAMGHLDKRGAWVQAYSPYPRMDSDLSLVPFQNEALAQSLSTDERCIVVLGVDRRVRIIDLDQGSLRESYGCPEVTGHVASIQKIEPGGRLAWLDQGGVLRVAHCAETLQVRHGENRIAFLPNQGLVAVDTSGALVAWSPESRRLTVLAEKLPAPVKVLRAVGATGLLLCVAGNKPQRVLLVATDARIELKLDLVWREVPIVDADVDASAQTILLLCRDRSLRRIETKSGELLAKPFYYEQSQPTAIWGAPARCALGSFSSAGWGFLATSTGQIGAWNWQSCELQRLPDWRTEQQGFLNLFTCLRGSGHLIAGLQSEAHLLTQSSQRECQRSHQAPVNVCVVTDKGQVVSASEHDGTACWFADAPGLHVLVRQSHPGLTAVAAIPASNDVLLGNSAGWCWRQPPDREVSRKEIFCLFDRKVVALASLDSGAMVAADITGAMMLVEDGSDDPVLLRHSSGSLRQMALLPATGQVGCWSLHAAVEFGETSHRLSLVWKNRETEVLRSNMKIECFACAPDKDMICLGSNIVRILKFGSHSNPVTLYQRNTEVDHISFIGDGKRLAVILHEAPWLEIWALVPDLPTIAAADLPGTVTSFAAHGDWLVVGFESGELLRLRLRLRC
ncbi:MAG: AAA family ATPase [Opitutaceae bacterium]|jgi:hypothetical protein